MPEEREDDVPHDEGTADRPVVLVVDDAPSSLGLLCDALEGAGYTVLVAADGESALERLDIVAPDAILLDWNMPIMSGLEFLKLLRAFVGGEKPRVVYCTVENDIGAIAMALKAGADDYMMKPFDRHLLESKFELVEAA